MTRSLQRTQLQRQICQIANDARGSVDGCDFKQHTNTNELTHTHIEEIIKSFDTKEDVEYFTKSIENNKIAENDYNLSVSSYVEAEDTREKIDITKLHVQIKTTVEKINALHTHIDAVVVEIEA